ncbi:ComEC/Rec2 family competence protein [Belliella marina]|uniref:ComEC/Rec2 family competence protein n=1 Tax=Belliella marina TaxID=1644146 RepID=A0ABW4VIK4_9BACT
MRFSEFPFLRYSFFFVLGVLLYPVFGEVPLMWLGLALSGVYLTYLVLVLVNKANKVYSFGTMIPALAYLQLILAGIVLTATKDICNQKDHLLNYEGNVNSYFAVVLANDEPKPNSIANRVKVLAVMDSVGAKLEVNAEVKVYHKGLGGMDPGDLLIVSGAPQQIDPPKNPNEFHYKDFMLRQQIGHSHYIGDNFLKVGKQTIQPIEDYFLGIRSRIMRNMDSLILDSHANQVAKALLLGQKKNLEKEVNEAYVTAGAMHVLAVSGLHVGIIYGFFFLFIKPYRLKVWRRVVYLSLIILLIWAYALLTGMSPSVMRAATMFSLMALAQMKSRSPSIFNAIALSALVLLVFDPFLVYAVGFQLSYLALTGILLIQPVLVKLWLPKSRILEYVWQISTVGVAAQLMTFPVSAHYFHVFPTYFILSNLVAIPGAFLIMAFGVPFMLLSEISFLAVPLAWITEKLIILVNLLIFGIQGFPFAKIGDIFLKTDFMIMYLTVLFLFLLLCTKPKKWQVYALMTVFLTYGVFQFSQIFQKDNKDLVIYSVAEGLALDYRDRYFFDAGIRQSDLSYKVMPNRMASQVYNSLPLSAFGYDGGLLVCLPGQEDVMEISSSGLIKTGGGVLSFFRYEEGIWVGLSEKDSLEIGDSAYKLIFQE